MTAAERALDLASWLAPSDVRREWLREWRAELAWQRARPHRASELRLFIRCLGAFAHAAWLRWDRWRPAMLLQDLRYAVRGLLRRPGFAVITIATLAIGIGANAAIFAAVDAVLLRPLPFAEPERLIKIFKSPAENPDLPCCSAAPPDFVDWRDSISAFSAVAAVEDDAYPLAGEGTPEQIAGATVTGQFFDVFGVRPLMGRGLRTSDEVIGGPDVVVLGSGLWRRRFGADAGVVGRRIQLDGVSREIVGVMPDGFAYPVGAEVWMPLRFSEAQLHVDRGRGSHYLEVVGRLRPGATLDEARVIAHALGARLSTAYPRTNREYNISVHPLRAALVGDARGSLFVLFGAVGFVLLIVCVNVGGLLLTRGMGRGRELAIRAAVGAGRAGLLRALLMECLVLALASGVLGLVIAWWGASIIAAVESGAAIPLLDQTRVDGRVALFTFAMSLVTMLLFGLAPAWRASRVTNVAERIRQDGPTSTGDAASRRWRGTLIVAQTAMAVLLLVGAGLLVRSFAGLLAVDPGFDRDNIQTFAVTLPTTRYATPPQRAELVDQLVTRLAQHPEVESAGAVMGLPYRGVDFSISTKTIDGRTLSDEVHDRLTFEVRVVTPDYFRTMGMTVVRGRGVTQGDDFGAPRVALVSESAARMLWPTGEPLGHHFTIGTRLGQGGDYTGGTVVGIVRDIHDTRPGQPPRPTVYFAHGQYPIDFVSIAVRVRGEPGKIIEPARALLADLDGNIPMFQVRSMEQLSADVVAKPRLYMALLGVFAAAAIFLAALGLYGMLAQLVTQRTREIAVRMALGAERRAVVAMVVGRAGWLAACGVVIGCAMAVAGGRVMRGMLFGVTETDVATYVVVAVAALAIALIASWLPARRAARIQPLAALRLD